MLICFDMDGTLIRPYMDDPEKRYDLVEPLPGRVEKVRRLVMRGYAVCIVTNQGGVAFGHNTEDQADAKIDKVVRLFGLRSPRSDGDANPRQVYACYSHPGGTAPWNDPIDAARRKPSGAMIREAVAQWPRHAKDGALMVGDRPEDAEAARDAGVKFMDAEEFFSTDDLPSADHRWTGEPPEVGAMRRCHPSPMIGRWSVVIRFGHATIVHPADDDPLRAYYYWVGFTVETDWPGVTAVELWHGNELAKAWDREKPPAATPPSSRVGTNSGHGHAWERPDGMKARCGGPALCRECAADAALVAKGGV